MADYTRKKIGGKVSTSPTYTNADLAPKSMGLTLGDLDQANAGVPGRPGVDSADPGVGGDPLAEARAFLSKRSVVPTDLETQNAVYGQRDTHAAVPKGAMAAHIGKDAKSAARMGVRGLGHLGTAAQWASIPAAFLGGPLVAGTLAAAGTAAKMPNRLWEGIEDPSQAMGPVEGAMEAAGLVGVRGAAQLAEARAALKGAESMAGSRVARGIGPSAYDAGEGALETLNPNFQTVNPRGYLDQLLERLNGSNPADRTVRNIGALEREAPGGLSDVAAGKVGRTPLPEGGGFGSEIDLSPLDQSPLDRVAQQARAKERFGRNYRAE